MKVLTKKRFKELHNNDLKLVHSFFRNDAGQCRDILNEYVKDNGMDALREKGMDVSRVDVGNQGDGYIVKVYLDNPFIFVEEKIDNALNGDTSDNTLIYNTIVYLIDN